MMYVVTAPSALTPSFLAPAQTPRRDFDAQAADAISSAITGAPLADAEEAIYGLSNMDATAPDCMSPSTCDNTGPHYCRPVRRQHADDAARDWRMARIVHLHTLHTAEDALLRHLITKELAA